MSDVAGGTGAVGTVRGCRVVVSGVTHGERAPGIPILSDVSMSALAGEVVVDRGPFRARASPPSASWSPGWRRPTRGSVLVGGIARGIACATGRGWRCCRSGWGCRPS